MEQTTSQQQPSKALIIAAFAAIYIIWGSTYIAMLIAIKDIPPVLMSGMRFMTAGLLLFAFCRLRGQAVPRLRDAGKLSLSGILMLFFGTGAVAWVEQYISSGLAAIIVATAPLWFVLFDKRQWKFNFSNKWIILGMLVGFAGVLTLFADKKSFDFSGDKMKLISFFVMIGGSISWVIGSLYLKYTKVEGSSGMKAATQMIAAGLVFFAVSAFRGEFNEMEWESISRGSILALLYLIFIGSLVGFMSYVWLLSVRSPALVGTYAYVNPVVAVFLGWLIASEPIGVRQLIALIVIIGGVILVTLAKDNEGNRKSKVENRK